MIKKLHSVGIVAMQAVQMGIELPARLFRMEVFKVKKIKKKTFFARTLALFAF